MAAIAASPLAVAARIMLAKNPAKLITEFFSCFHPASSRNAADLNAQVHEQELPKVRVLSLRIETNHGAIR